MAHLSWIEKLIQVMFVKNDLHLLVSLFYGNETLKFVAGTETIKLKPANVPAVITCDLRLNTPRYPTMPNIMKAKKKPVQVISLEDMVKELGLSLDDILKPRNQVVEVYEPPPRKEGELVESVDALIERLKEKGLVG